MSTPLPRTLSVLLVEDSPADGRLLLEAFRPAITAGDVIVQTVKSLALAADALKTYDFSCVLLDLGLPDGHGVSSVRALREIDRKTAIIVLTGLADEKLAAEALTLGAQDYLVKGESDGEQLLKQLRRAVQRNRQTYALETRRDKAFFEASHDTLTLLPNAALFADRARQQMASIRSAASINSPAFTLGYLALQGLDAVREHQGELRTNDLIKTLAERWGENLRPSDTLAHIASGTFAILRQPIGMPAEWSALMQDCQQQLQSLKGTQAGSDSLSLQTAVVQAEDDGQGIDALLATAQQQARVSIPLASGGHDLHTHSSNGLAAHESAAACWQPWVDVTTRRCIGLTYQDFTQEPVTGQDAATRTLAATAALIQQTRAWASTQFDPPLLSIEIDLAALQSDGFVTALIEQFSAVALAPNRVQLELSEAAFRRLSQHLPALNRLRSKGFRLLLKGDGSQDISLHDFAACALDGYKLSPALVRSLIDEDLKGTARRFISAILGAAQQLGAVVIATGVDTDAAVAALRLVGVRFMQGRALLPPLEPEYVSLSCERPVALRS